MRRIFASDVTENEACGMCSYRTQAVRNILSGMSYQLFNFIVMYIKLTNTTLLCLS